MGLFTPKKEVFVSSVAYNLAGDVQDRPSYLKSLVVRNVLGSSKQSLSETLQSGYLRGPGIKMSGFYRWAEKPENYGAIGLPEGELTPASSVNPVVLQDQITVETGQTSWVQRVEIGAADYGRWIEQWFLDNAPEQINTEWQADIAEAFGTTPEITLQLADSSTVTFPATDYISNSWYIYAWYNIVSGEHISELVTGEVVELGTDPFPSTDGWTFLQTTSDSAGTELVYSRLTYTGASADGAQYLREVMHLFEENGPPVDRSYRIDTQTYTGMDYGSTKLFIYRIGSGNLVLDTLALPGESHGQFYPYLPIRLENTFLSESYFPSEFAQVSKAYKKATGQRVSELIEKIEDNPQLGDIDHAFVVFGVSLNTIERSSLRYLYSFFEKLQLTQIGGPAIYDAWISQVEEQNALAEAWEVWWLSQQNPDSTYYGEPEPERPQMTYPPTNMIRIAGDPSYRYDIQITWSYIDNGSGSGLGKPGAKVGELWTVVDESAVNQRVFGSGTTFVDAEADTTRFRIYWQRTATTFTFIDVFGLWHQNYVYGVKAVAISAKEALADEHESGFIVPLHYDTMKETPLVHMTQMSMSCVYVVFNCYVIKKQRWYETWIFKILLVVAIVIVSTVFTGGAGIGLLGAHIAVGSALGLTGMTAAIVGAVANAMAALVLTSLLETVGSALFGPEFGALFAAIAMFFIGSIATNFHMYGEIALNWGNILTAENLLRMTSAVGNTYTNIVNQGTLKLGQEMQGFMENARAETAKIQQAFLDQFGYGAGQIDPMMFVEANTPRIVNESSDTFLTRTLMTGSEIAELSQDLLYNFAEYSTKLPDAYT